MWLSMGQREGPMSAPTPRQQTRSVPLPLDHRELTQHVGIDPEGGVVLERDHQIVAAPARRLDGRGQHRQEERIDQRAAGDRILIHQQGDGLGALQAQIAGVGVDFVIQRAGRLGDFSARLLADHAGAAEGARDSRLRHAGQFGDVEGGRSFNPQDQSHPVASCDLPSIPTDIQAISGKRRPAPL